MDTFPPSGYISVPSIIEGIEVFAPAPPKPDALQEVIEFKCPQCGGTTAYSIAEGGLKCTQCGYNEVSQLPVAGKGAQSFEFTLETMQTAAVGWGDTRKELECQSCGARTTLPSGQLTATCPFCRSNKVIQREAAASVLRPRFLVPFQIDPQHCLEITRAFLGSSWMAPRALAAIIDPAGFTPLYLPFWTFDSLASADWRAEVGHEETERYYDAADKQWKTRIRIVWRWESGKVSVPFDDLLIPGSARLSQLLINKISDYDLDALKLYEPKYLAGMQAQAYDIPLEAAWEKARQQMRETTRQTAMNQASTSRIRNFSMQLDFQDESWRYILLPLYLAVYPYGGKVYQVLVNGQSGAVAGQRPVDWNKIWLVIAVLLAPGLLLVLASLILLLLDQSGTVFGTAGFVLLLVGLIGSAVLFFKAQGLDDA